MGNIKVSVIVPVYNVEQYLRTCVESLLAQTLKDIELIFVNDASPDNSLNILREYEEKHPGLIRVIDSKENLKQGGARNLGIKEAQGEYIGFVDSDDFAAPTMYEDLVRRAEETNADAVFIQYSVAKDENDTQSGIPFIKWPSDVLALNNKKLESADREKLIINPIGGVFSAIWRKSRITDNNVWFPAHIKYEDNYWTSLMWEYIDKVSFIEKIDYYYRANETSTVRIRNPKFHSDRITAENMLLDELERRDLLKKYHKAWEYNYITRFCINTYISYVKLFDKVEKDFLKNLIDSLNNRFPDWKTNEHYKTRLSGRRKVLMSMINRAPVLSGKILNRVYKIKS